MSQRNSSSDRLYLKLPEEHRLIGKYGRLHREYLREVHPARLNTLILTGELWTYLANLNEQAQERIDTIIEQMKTAEGVSLTTNYAGNVSMGAGRASGRLWLTAPVIYPNEQRKRRNTQNEF